jgi:MFS family permease
MGLSIDQVAIFMTVTIIGGAVLQWPIGRLSDSGDRRRTLALACMVAAAAAGIAILFSGTTVMLLYVAFFWYGGLAFSVYPVAVAHLLDHVEPADILPACSTVLLLHGVGAALGPAFAGFAMQQLGPRAFPGFLMLTQLLLGLYVFSRLFRRQREASGESHFHAMLRTTPTAMEMLPEVEIAPEQSPDQDAGAGPEQSALKQD